MKSFLIGLLLAATLGTASAATTWTRHVLWVWDGSNGKLLMDPILFGVEDQCLGMKDHIHNGGGANGQTTLPGGMANNVSYKASCKKVEVTY